MATTTTASAAGKKDEVLVTESGAKVPADPLLSDAEIRSIDAQHKLDTAPETATTTDVGAVILPGSAEERKEQERRAEQMRQDAQRNFALQQKIEQGSGARTDTQPGEAIDPSTPAVAGK